MTTSSPHLSLRVGQYNLLCPTYGVKWDEREACVDWVSKDDHGGSNWARRWPALQRVLQCGEWDVVTLEELEDSVREDVTKGLRDLGLALLWFDHPGRADALGIAYNGATLNVQTTASRPYPPENPKATTGRVDFRHGRSGRAVRVLVTHQRGGIPAQLDDLFAFAAEDAPEDCVTVINGDFNEDFGDAALCLRPGYAALPRTGDEPVVSRPSHKLGDDNSSGKGLIDYIFVANAGHGTCALLRDEASMRAIAMSHAPCDETGEWPSDHGIEALTVSVTLSATGHQ